MSNEAYLDADGRSLMDELLRAGVPEIKLALGEVIDRENARPLPPRYARLLPDSMLMVTLRDDAAEALEPIAADVERELTDSCNRHGSLYDRSYRVRLQRSSDPDAPLYAVTTLAGKDEEGGDAAEAPRAAEAGQPPSERSVPIPIADDDATRIDAVAPTGWEAGRWVLIVEGDDGEEREVFRVTDPFVTVGRGTDDPSLRSTIAISDAPHVSRRQLALLWEDRDGAPGFKVFNLGLNVIHLPGLDVPGAHVSKGPLQLDDVPEKSTGWLPPGVPLRIGEHGPALRIDEVPPEEEEADEDAGIDPDATVFE